MVFCRAVLCRGGGAMLQVRLIRPTWSHPYIPRDIDPFPTLFNPQPGMNHRHEARSFLSLAMKATTKPSPMRLIHRWTRRPYLRLGQAGMKAALSARREEYQIRGSLQFAL
jgi:hypothetical protein